MPSGQNELVALQQQIAQEIKGDVPAIAQGIFGDNKNHPDMAQVANQQLDQLYIQKYQEQDRAWLQSEAQRDPNQFMDVAKRIGVTMPDPNAPPVPTLDHAALAQNLMANAAGPAGPPPAAPVGLPGSAPVPLPPPALPAPMPAPVAAPIVASVPPPVAPPVILGPNGQPLPPTGM